MLRLLLGIVLVLLLGGCASKPTSSINKIAAKAKAGDIQGVYLYFDKPKINEDLTKQIIKQIESGNYNAFVRERSIQKVKNELEDILKQKVWDVIENEVKKGKDGSLANVKVVKEEISNNYNATVLIQLDNNNQTTLQFSKINDKWLITGLNFNDVVKNTVFKKINVKPSFSSEKVKIVEGFVDKYPDEKFYSTIKAELQKLVGSDYDHLLNNLSVTGPIKKDGQFITIDGLAPHLGGSEEAIILLDTKDGILSVAILKDGKEVKRYSDIKDEDDYPEQIKQWNKQ